LNNAHKAQILEAGKARFKSFQKRVKQGLGAKFPTSRVRFAASTAFAYQAVHCGDVT